MIDLEAGYINNDQRTNQKKIPRIYDVDESMSLKKVSRKVKTVKRTISEEMINDY